MTVRQRAAVYLDHVSLTAATRDLEQLGFRVTPTMNAEDHSRILLDGVYLEVTSSQQAGALTARRWFIRPEDPHQAAERLRRAGVGVIGPSDFHGHDGTWRDVEIDIPDLGVALPMLTRRIDATFESWPPPLHDPHPNGARRITEIRVGTPDVEAVATVLTALGLHRNENAFALHDDVRVLVQSNPGGPRITGLLVERDGQVPLELMFTGGQ